MSHQKATILCILDGWGYREEPEYNAIAQADTPNWDRFLKTYPFSLVQASEGHVGLPQNQMGNSEVGHTNIGAGRVVLQDLPRINKSITDRSLSQNPTLLNMIKKIQSSTNVCHVMGLISPGGVHAHQDHIFELLKILAENNIKVYLHAFLDGRDTPPTSALDYIKAFQDKCNELENVHIATISGRYYAMDRDNRWDRIEKAYSAMVSANAPHTHNAQHAIQQSYEGGTSDEFVVPTVVGDYTGMKDGDALLMCNFRADRARQILTALTAPGFSDFKRDKSVTFAATGGMIEYSSKLQHIPALFPPIQLENVLGEVIANNNLKQLRIAETEKYAHVTFFLNGGREEPFVGEERTLIPSPQVATYDETPEMSALEVTEKVVDAVQSQQYDFIVINYANTDMVGHTGDMEAAKKAVEAIDSCLGNIEKAALATDSTLFITADHGNVEQMYNPNIEKAHTAHTCNPVPLMVISQQKKEYGLEPGMLADIAPTVLYCMGLEQPAEMTGKSLLLQKS